MVEALTGFRRTLFPDQVHIEQIGEASAKGLRCLLEDAERVMGNTSSVHTRVTLCLEDEGHGTLHCLLLDYEYELFSRKHLYGKQLTDE